MEQIHSYNLYPSQPFLRAGLVGLDVGCIEPLQIVSYLPGQSTELHHDAVQNIPGMGNVPKR